MLLMTRYAKRCSSSEKFDIRTCEARCSVSDERRVSVASSEGISSEFSRPWLGIGCWFA